jgi:hypothetical protein
MEFLVTGIFVSTMSSNAANSNLLSVLATVKRIKNLNTLLEQVIQFRNQIPKIKGISRFIMGYKTKNIRRVVFINEYEWFERVSGIGTATY